jgi:hypothetical protein
MTVVVSGGMLLTFDSVAKEIANASSAQPSNMAVLEAVTIVGRRV